jgi:hypothetical protein
MFIRIRLVVEHIIGRLRDYQTLTTQDPHHCCHQKERVLAVSGLTNSTKWSQFVF